MQYLLIAPVAIGLLFDLAPCFLWIRHNHLGVGPSSGYTDFPLIFFGVLTESKA